ncbi:hypothetical protein [Iodidimonas gelatinilytica]|nr:hypothetical protein [Iodidimonas gelatinilytica]
MASDMKTLVDARGRILMPHEGEARIVSLSPALTELVFALDLGTHLVGRTGRCAKSVEGLAAVSCVGICTALIMSACNR